MLTRIEIDGFKSFTNFAMDFSPLTVIAGLNASGKSNLFDALHLLSLLAEHDLNTAFDKVQRGSNLELFTQYADGRHAEEMRFAVSLTTDAVLINQQIMKAQRIRASCVYKIIIRRTIDDQANESLFVKSEDASEYNENGSERLLMMIGTPRLYSKNEPFYPSGRQTELSQTHSGDAALVALRLAFQQLKSLHLDPQKLSAVSPAQAFGLPGTLNALADNLAGVLWRLEKTDPYLVKRIAQRLAALVPGIKEIVVRHDDYYNQYRVFVHTTAGQRFPLHLLSEGTLRLLALCTLAFDDQQHGVLGLEEPENGVHPGLLKRLAELLRDLSTNEPPEAGEEPWPLRQVIVNTHSPGLIKACLEAAAAQEKGGGKPDLTVWFSQLVGRPVEEGGQRVMRRVTEMQPVMLPQAGTLPADTGKRIALAQLVSFLESANADDLLNDLGLQPIAEAL